MVTTSNPDLLDLKSWRKPDRLPVWHSEPPCVTSASKPAHNRWSTVAHVPGASVDVGLKKGRKSWSRAEPERVSACRSILRGQTDRFYLPRASPLYLSETPTRFSKTFLSCLPKGFNSLHLLLFLSEALLFYSYHAKMLLKAGVKYEHFINNNNKNSQEKVLQAKTLKYVCNISSSQTESQAIPDAAVNISRSLRTSEKKK